MLPTLPWPVSPEFEDALALATQRHLARPSTAPQTPQSLSLEVLDPYISVSPEAVPRSGSLMMKTRVAVRDKNPHRFQVVPLRDAAQRNRDKDSKLLLNSKPRQPPAPWIRQLAVPRPSGVGLGLNVPGELPPAPETPERGRDHVPRGDMSVEQALRKSVLRTLQGGSPKRPLLGSPDRKENRLAGTTHDEGKSASPKKRPRRRLYASNSSQFDADTTITPSNKTVQDRSWIHSTPIGDKTTLQTIPANLPSAISASSPILPTFPTAILLSDSKAPGAPFSSHASTDTVKSAHQGRRAPFFSHASTDTIKSAHQGRRTLPTATSRHFKSPSLGAIHHLLSASTATTAPALPDPDATITNSTSVRCRKRTNTLSAASAGSNTKRYGVYTPGKLDFSPVFGETLQEDTAEESAARIESTFSFGTLLGAYSYSWESLPSVYSQESFAGENFVWGSGTRPLRITPRTHTRFGRRGLDSGLEEPHAIVLELIAEVDKSICEWEV